MSGMDLGLPKVTLMSLQEQRARTILRNVRSSGHPYVELRKDGKRFVFFCTLCLAPCYSDTVLWDHLRGNLHRQRLPAAKATLIGTNAWPFNDGVLFFDYSVEEASAESGRNQNRLLDYHDNEDNLAVVEYGKNRPTNTTNDDKKHVAISLVHEYRSVAVGLNENDEKCHLVIPGVLTKATVSSLKVRFVGFGKRAVRLTDNDGSGSCNTVKRIWCEWLGNIGPTYEDASKSEDLDFGVVTFSYNHDLSKDGLFENVNNLLPSSKFPELKDSEDNSRKRKRSPSDPENISESCSTQYDSTEECSSLLDQCDDEHLNTRVISNKAVRRELRKKKQVSAGRMCPICKHKMLPEKDAAAIMNMKTGKLACSSRNFNGAFHVFHTSCLIHWILLCDYEMLKNQLASPKESQTDERNSKGKQREIGKSGGIEEKRIPTITSVFCPECQGSGVNTEENQMEPRTCFSLSEIFKFKIRLSDARKAWIKSHEKWLLNCSVGFDFPCESEDEEVVQGKRGLLERVSTVKLLPFFRAEE